MKAKTKRRIVHLVTKKRLVKKHISRHVLRTFFVIVATISTGSLAYAITTTHPIVSVAIFTSGPGGRVIEAPAPPNQPVSKGPDQVGRGSWYALGLPAPDSLTCASTTFPRGTYLEVTNRYNGRKVVCLVNDYGPEAWTGRVIDLSRGSFRQVDSLGTGTIPVEIRVVHGPTGFNIPLNLNLGTLFGYRQCFTLHDAKYCYDNRQTQ